MTPLQTILDEISANSSMFCSPENTVVTVYESEEQSGVGENGAPTFATLVRVDIKVEQPDGSTVGMAWWTVGNAATVASAVNTALGV